MSGNLKYVVGKRGRGEREKSTAFWNTSIKIIFEKIKCLYLNVCKSFSDSNNCPTTIIMAVLGMRDE